jgi:hypothetical protein
MSLWKVEVTRNVYSFGPMRHGEVEVMAKLWPCSTRAEDVSPVLRYWTTV